MSYTKRRCNKCGFTDIQPNMKQIEVEYEVGSSSAAISKRSFFTALLFENKSAQRQNTNWLTGNTKRKYKRKRRVWVCGNGCSRNQQSTSQNNNITEEFDYSPKGWLNYKLDHLESMLGDLEIEILELSELKKEINVTKPLSDSNAKSFTKKIEKLQPSIEREIMRLGEIYKFSNESSLAKTWRILFYVLNTIMWAVGGWFFYVAFLKS